MIPFYLQKFYCISMHYMQYQMSLCTVLVSNQNSFETGIQSTYYIVLPIWLNHLMETRPFSPPSLNPWNSQWPQNRRMSAPVKACTSYLCFKGCLCLALFPRWASVRSKSWSLQLRACWTCHGKHTQIAVPLAALWTATSLLIIFRRNKLWDSFSLTLTS